MINAVYIHIPFCKQICTYCDFCKFNYNEEWIKKYLRALKEEITSLYKKEEISSIYIGGGTPSSLNIEDLEELFNILSSFNISENVEYTIECNSDDISEEKLLLFKKYGINRLSIGVQTFDENRLKILNRKLNVDNIKKALSMFDNVNVDLMYALPNQSLENVKEDVKKILELNPTHVSLYSLIIEPNTILYINKTTEVSDELQNKMYYYLCDELKRHGYNHYEISNFSKLGYESKHNLVYWNNEEYYGFGLGASGYVNGVRYENTRSFHKYCLGERVYYKENIELQRKIEDEFMLGLRKINGINKKHFIDKYKFEINDIDIVKNLLKKELLIETEENIFVNPKYIYVSNEIIEKFINNDLLVH